MSEQSQNDAKKILIVDSDKFLVGMYSVKFESRGFEVDSATSSVDALKKLRDDKVFDIILLDIVMPDESGMEFLRTVRRDNLCPDTTVIILTNETKSSKIEEAKNLKAAGYIVKSTSIPSEVFDEVVKIHAARKNK